MGKYKWKNLEEYLETHPREEYFPEALKSGTVSLEEMKREYSYLRGIANKRLANFVGSEYETHKSYVKNANKFVPLENLKNERDLMYKLYEARKFIEARTSSISGIRGIERQTIETAHEHGMSWLNKGNLKEFGNYMDSLRAKYGSKQFDSEGAQELFGMKEKKKLNLSGEEIQQDFGYWLQHSAELDKIPKKVNPTLKSSEDYKKYLSGKNK